MDKTTWLAPTILLLKKKKKYSSYAPRLRRLRIGLTDGSGSFAFLVVLAVRRAALDAVSFETTVLFDLDAVLTTDDTDERDELDGLFFSLDDGGRLPFALPGRDGADV